jgi:hypothetical protein
MREGMRTEILAIVEASSPAIDHILIYLHQQPNLVKLDLFHFAQKIMSVIGDEIKKLIAHSIAIAMYVTVHIVVKSNTRRVDVFQPGEYRSTLRCISNINWSSIA